MQVLNCTVSLQTCHNIPTSSALRWRKHGPSRGQNDPVPAKPNFQEPKAPDLCSKLYVKILHHELPGSEQKLKHFILESQTQDNFISPATSNTHLVLIVSMYLLFKTVLFWNLVHQIWEVPQRRGKSILSVRKWLLSSIL